MMTVCFIVATKDRPDDLRRMLESLAAQTRPPSLVIVVDSSAHPVSRVVDEFRGRLRVDYIRHRPPSASAQRNAGIAAAPSDIGLLGFLDDDAALEPDAMEKMLAFWESAPPDLGGCAFNMANHPAQAFSALKRWRIVKTLELYGEPGRVMPSGWQTMTGFVSHDTWVDWIPSGAALWRAEIVRTCRFDEFFDGYSYLEDLDFSYTIRRRWRLAIVADARYHHYPSAVRAARPYSFGRIEVRNRLYFVSKHGLSYPRCWLGLALRMGITLYDAAARFDRGALARAFGNCAGMAAALTGTIGSSVTRGANAVLYKR